MNAVESIAFVHTNTNRKDFSDGLGTRKLSIGSMGGSGPVKLGKFLRDDANTRYEKGRGGGR